MSTSDGYRATAQLRWVMRIDARTGERQQILQQLWTSDYQGEQDEWRNVPLAYSEQQLAGL